MADGDTPHERWKRTLAQAGEDASRYEGGWTPIFLEHPPIRIQNSGLIAPESKKNKSHKKKAPAAAPIGPTPIHRFKDPGPPLE